MSTYLPSNAVLTVRLWATICADVREVYFVLDRIRTAAPQLDVDLTPATPTAPADALSCAQHLMADSHSSGKLWLPTGTAVVQALALTLCGDEIGHSRAAPL